MKKHIIHYFFFYVHKKKNIQKTHKIKIMLTIKLVFHYQVRQESYLFLFKKGREKKKKNESKNNEFMSNFLFSSKTKGRHVRDSTICEKLKRQWQRK